MRRIVQQAGRQLFGAARAQQGRIDAIAGLESSRAAGMKAAPPRHVGGIRELPGQQLAGPGPAGRRHWHGGDEGLRVWMAGALDHVDCRALLDHPPQVHDRDPVAEGPRQAEIVSDEDQRKVPAPLELHQDGQDLGPHGGVEHGDRLVADQPLGLEHERRGDCHALALAARELVRIAGQEALRLQPDVLEGAPDAPVVLAARHPLDDERLGDDRGHSLTRVQRLVGVLEDHLHPPAQLAQAPLAVHGLAVQRHVAGGGRHQAEHGAGKGGFPATGLPHHSQDLAALPLQGDPVDRSRHAAARPKLHGQVADFHQGVVAAHDRLPRWRTRSAGHSVQGA